MINGDIPPTAGTGPSGTRLEAMSEAAALLVAGKLQSNPESTVGILTSGGSSGGGSIRLLSSPTDGQNEGRLLALLHGLKTEGKGGGQFLAAVKTAFLALKHRRNKLGGQRIIAFVGSPLEVDAPELKKLATSLKKNNVAVDVILLGENDLNRERMEEFVKVVAKEEDGRPNSSLLVAPPGSELSALLISSTIYSGGGGGGGGGGGSSNMGGGGGGGGGAGGFADYGGIDPNLDPELAMAMRISMEEARAAAVRVEGGAAGASSSSSSAAAVTSGGLGEGSLDFDDDAALQAALALSMADDSEMTSSSNAPPVAASTSIPSSSSSSSSSSTTIPAEAASSSSATSASAAPTTTTTNESSSGAVADPDFAMSLLGGLPGVDMNDPEIVAMLAQLQAQQPGDESSKKKKEEEKK
jgi:26S proteasome regulatory subunit N10